MLFGSEERGTFVLCKLHIASFCGILIIETELTEVLRLLSFIRKIISMFFQQGLSQEKKEELSSDIAGFRQDFGALNDRYITYAEIESLTEKWKPVRRDVRAVISKIPYKDPLYAELDSFLKNYSRLDKTAATQNAHFLTSESQRLDGMFSDIDGKSLDDQQRAAVLCDEDRNLVLAGAGSGKTLTISGKVRYLCEEKGIAPEDILLIAFTKKAAEEMTFRISSKIGIPMEATTFHKLGLNIITSAQGKRPEVYEELPKVVKDYFTNVLLNNQDSVADIIEYFAYYLHIPAHLEEFDSLGEAYDYEKSVDFETLRSKYDRTKYIKDEAASRMSERRTLKDEFVKSLDEVSIANFLFLHGVNYEYEHPYPYASDDPTRKAYKPDFYLPDYDIYIEHFGIDRSGRLPWLSPIEELKYLEEMDWKRDFHKKHGTCLLETYSYYSSEGCLLQMLESMLAEKNVEFHTPDFKDVFETIYEKETDRYFSEFIQLCCTFISLFKSSGRKLSDLDYLRPQNPKYQNDYFRRRIELFRQIIRPVIEKYDNTLKELGAIDFSDMINNAADLVAGGCDIHPYKWVIIDEFQDISAARYKLVHAILERTHAKLLCVGDDWQSIYRFTGSDISLFTHFEHYFGKAKIMRIEKTYRNSQQLIDEAGAFVMKNSAQFEKSLRSDKSLSFPIVFMGYRDDPFKVLKRIIDKIIDTHGVSGSILFLGRTNYDIELLRKSELFNITNSGNIRLKEYPDTPVSFLSIHKAKGLEADNVVLLNFQNSTLGFPNKISDDPLLELVLADDDSFMYAEERRLFYVALTRTRNRIYVLVNENIPSEFLREFHASVADGVYMSSDAKDAEMREVSCPRCKTGHLVIRQNERVNKYFVGCSNFPMCSYSVPDTSILENPIRCPDCGGFLVKRKGKYGYFLGCTNYPLCENTAEMEE